MENCSNVTSIYCDYLKTTKILNKKNLQGKVYIPPIFKYANYLAKNQLNGVLETEIIDSILQ